MPVSYHAPYRRSEDVASLIPKKGSRSRPLFDPPIVKRALTRFARQAEPAHT